MNISKPIFLNKDLSKDLPPSLVNIDDKSRSNLFTWRGQFSPELIEQLLIHYADKHDTVFDPFLGSGTILHECALLGLSGFGTEINPAAVSFSKIYELVNHAKQDISFALTEIQNFLDAYIFEENLFSKSSDLDQFEQALILFFETTKCTSIKIILQAYIVGLDFKTKKTTSKRIASVWKQLSDIIKNLPQSNPPLKCYMADARKTPLQNNSIDLIITSPPYINVFNYHQNYRSSVELMGIDVLKIAKSEIGANRKFRQNRFLTVVQYCMDLAEVFLELRRICTKNAKIIFIVGVESNIRRTSFKNAELITKIAEICGFNLIGSQTRSFSNKFGKEIYEDILRMQLLPKNNIHLSPIEKAKKIGQEALINSTKYCSDDIKEEILMAIKKSENITTSPLL